MKSKLLTLLTHLNLTQHRDIKDFAKVRFNKLSGRDQQILNDILLHHRSPIHITEDELWELVLIGNEKISKNKNRIKNRLLKMIEKYLSMQQLDQHSKIRDYILSKYYASTGAIKNASLLWQSTLLKLESSSDFEDNIYLYWMHELALHHNKNIRRHDRSIDKMEKSLNDFYIGQRLRLICEIANRGQIIGREDRIPELSSEVINLLQKTSSEHILIYGRLFELITKPSLDQYDDIDNYLTVNQGKLTPKISRELYSYLINFCVRQLNQGSVEFAQKYLHLFEVLEDKGWLLENGTIGLGRLRNSILAAIIVDQLEWAKERLDRYKMALLETKMIDRQAFFNLNAATIELHDSNLDKSYVHAKAFMDSTTYRKDFYSKLACDRILLKLYYLDDELEVASNKLQSIRAYINPKKLSHEVVLKHRYFLRIMDKLINKKSIKEEELQDRLSFLDYLWYQKFIKKSSS